MPTDKEFTRILQWPGYQVYRHAIDEQEKVLELWVRRKRGNRKLECSGCGRKFEHADDSSERAVRDLPWASSGPQCTWRCTVCAARMRAEGRAGATVAE